MPATSIPVLCYHAVGGPDGIPTAAFEAHLDAVRDLGFAAIPAGRLLDICLGRARPKGRELVLTFDDCHLSNWVHALPILARRGLCATFFAVTDFTGTGPRRTIETAPPLKSMPESFVAALKGDASQFLNAEELEALVRDFGMEVHAHGGRHQGCFRSLRRTGFFDEKAHWACHGIYPAQDPRLPVFEIGSAYVYNGFWPSAEPVGPDGLPALRLRPDAERLAFCRADLGRSFTFLRAVNRGERQLLCWPWGEFDEMAIACAKEAGFAGAFGLERGPNRRGTNPLRIARIGVARGKDADWLASRLRLHSHAAGSRLFPKTFGKKPEIKNILYMTNSTLLTGGSRQMMHNALAMRDLGLAAHVVVPSGSNIQGTLKNSGIRVIAHDGFEDTRASARFLNDFARENAIDVVHAFHGAAARIGVWARLSGGRFRLFFNRGVVYDPNLLSFAFARIGAGFICNSLACRDVLARFGVPRSRINVVYNSLLDPDQPAAAADGQRLTVLYVGNMAPVKGFDVFLKAVEILEREVPGRFEFLALGVDVMERFRGVVPDAVLARVRSPGFIGHAEVVSAYAASQIYVMSSRLESMPNSLFEAFAAGLPVAACRTGGVAELVRDGVNGRLCAVEDAACLARAVLDLAQDPATRRRMGALNRRIAREFLSNRAKGLNLARVYFGEHLCEPLPIERLAGHGGAP
jgi:glycosyltransferase involved in cell wall biosynthesis